MKLIWDELARDDYVWWQMEDRKVLKRINALIKDISRNGNEGIGKPETLKHGVPGLLVTPRHRRTPLGLQNRGRRDPDRRMPLSLRQVAAWRHRRAQ